ncbi:MAG TPA: hypothetical protein VGA36_01495, partial [Nitriliruptorales bacterium]
MFPTAHAVRELLGRLLDEWQGEGRDTDDLRARLDRAGSDLEELAAIGVAIPDLPVRDDWPWVEPDDLAAVEAEAAGDWDRAPRPARDARQRVATAFLGRVAGCMLGKPLELELSRAQLEAGLRAAGCWPLDDYLPEAALDALPTRQGQWRELVRERITHVAPDDDINYTL